MKQLPAKIKPARGYSHLLHILLKAMVPLWSYIFVRVDFVGLAIALVLLSKWRMLAVRPRYWLAHIISNGVDIFVSLAFVIFMSSTSVQWWQLIWAVLFGVWVIVLKPRSDVLSVSAQAMLCQLLALSALFIKFGGSPIIVLVLGTWVITYISARHFLTSFDEEHINLYSHLWSFISASLAFVLAHWLVFYGLIAQTVLILTVVGYSLAGMYYLHSADRLTQKLRKQFLGITTAILVLVLALSDWTGKVIG